MPKDFFSLPEAALRLGISRIAVFKKVRKGQLEAIRIGRNWAIAASVLDRRLGVVPRRPPSAGSVPKHHETRNAGFPAVPDKEMSDMGWD